MSGPAGYRGQGQGRHWASINEISFVAGMRALFWIARVCGRWPFRIVLYPVLGWYLLTKPLPRNASRDYLRRVAQHGGAPARLSTLAHFAAFAENILDKMLLWGGLYPTDRVRFFGTDVIAAALARGEGGVLLCSHLGNLELCRVLSRQRNDMQVTVLVHTKHAQAFNRMLAKLNPDSQLNLMQVTEMSPATAMLLTDKVARGEFVVIAGDRIPVSPNPRVAVADFMGAPAPFPVGPYILAGILQCPIYLLFNVHTADGAEVHFEFFRDTVRVPRGQRDAALAALAGAYAQRLEHHCLRAPLQWFNFYDFWHLPTSGKAPGATDMDNHDAPR